MQFVFRVHYLFISGEFIRFAPLPLCAFALRSQSLVIPGPPILTANDLALSYGYQRLLESVTLSVAPGEKVGLVGHKSLLKWLHSLSATETAL